MHGHFAFDARRDPTGTIDIRSRFRRDMAQRWSKLTRLLREAITGDPNLLGLGPIGVPSIGRSHDPVRDFQRWLDAALQQVVLSGHGDWTQHYLDEAASRARSRAHTLVPAMGPGQHENVQHLVTASAAVELQGVVEAASQRIMRVVSGGMLGKMKQSQIARMAAEEARKVGGTRSAALVEMSVNSAFNQASLDTFKALGVTRVGIDPEFTPAPKLLLDASNTEEIVEVLTAGDDLVCEECEAISEEGPYEIDEARDLIPAHPNCRCAFVPFFDLRFAEQER